MQANSATETKAANASAPNSGWPHSRAETLHTVLQIALVAWLAYACSRFLLPFAGILLWSAILPVMLYPLHLRLVGRLGNRLSALLIGLVGIAVMLVPVVIMDDALP
jgi:predicted PurR-regulated permease PerM